MSICTNCAQKPKYCTCTDDSWTDVQFSDLSYTNEQFEVPVSVIRGINRAKTEHRDDLADWVSMTQNAVVSPRNVRLAYLWATVSIQTDSGTLDEVTDELRLNDFGTLKASLEESADGDKKWEKVHDFWTSDKPKQVADHIRSEDWIEAQAVLSGLSEDSGRTFHYCRPVKANMVTALFGDPHALCLDSRRHRVLEDTLKDALPATVRGPDHTHPTDALGTYRQQGLQGTAEPKPAASEEFLQESKALARSPEELRVITSHLRHRVAEETRATPEEVHHLLFILGGPTTFHRPLQEMMDTQ